MSTAQPSAGRLSSPGTGGPGDGLPAPGRHQRLGLALVVIATAQLMVVLDATIVNVALFHIQAALGFSGSGLEWVLNAYALTFGGLLLGGRAGDILGRRRVFIAGIILFSAASLLGGFATSQAWLIGARALQGVGGAIVAPTALSLVTTNFPEGPPRNRAMGVYASVSIAGAAVGLMAGGLLTTYLSWRWVLFVNVPIGLAVALMAPRVLGESQRHSGRFDLPGALTGTLGLGALVYGLSSAAPGAAGGVSHWTDPKVLASLAAAPVLLAAFVVIELASDAPLMPLRIFRARDRTGSNLIMLCIGTAMFGMFFFLTVFVETVWGYSALKTGIAYLPMVAMIMLMAGASTQLVPRVGARPLLIASAAIAVGGMFWLSRINEHSTYAGGLLGPMLVTAAGLGLAFMPATLVALAKVEDKDAGVASSLPNVGQQVGGAIGLAILGTIAWTMVSNTLQSSARAAKTAAAAAARAGHPVHLTAAQAKAAQTALYDHALATGFSRGFVVSAGIMLIALVVAVVVIRVKRADLAGVEVMQA